MRKNLFAFIVLTAILSKTEIHDDYEPGIPGSCAVGLMDLDFDHSPEVLAAYAGGSIMRLWGKTYG